MRLCARRFATRRISWIDQQMRLGALLPTVASFFWASADWPGAGLPPSWRRSASPGTRGGASRARSGSRCGQAQVRFWRSQSYPRLTIDALPLQPACRSASRPDTRSRRTARRCRQRLLGTGWFPRAAGTFDRQAISMAKLVWFLCVRCGTIPLSSMSLYQKTRRSQTGINTQYLSASARCFFNLLRIPSQSPEQTIPSPRNFRGDANAGQCEG